VQSATDYAFWLRNTLLDSICERINGRVRARVLDKLIKLDRDLTSLRLRCQDAADDRARKEWGRMDVRGPEGMA
jgi:hypothetical protein